MASGSADTYARNMNRGDQQFTGGSPQSAYMALHQDGVAVIDGRMYALIHGTPRELTPELMEEMQGAQYSDTGQYYPETQGFSAGQGRGTAGGYVGERPRGALSGANAVTSPHDRGMHSAETGLGYAGWQMDDQAQTQRDRAGEFRGQVGYGSGARLRPRDTSRGGPAPALVPGGSSYEESWPNDPRRR